MAATTSASSAIAAARKRAVGAIIGSLVADAATAPVHWIYDMDKMGKLVAEGPTEFHAPEGPFYRRDVGLHTGYGDLNATSLKVLAATGGAWTPEKYATALQLDFGPGSEYDQFGQLEGGIAQELWPVPGPWLQAGMRTFLRKLREGKSVEEAADETDDQGDAFSRVPALAAARAFGAVASGADLAAAKAALTSEVQAFVGTYQAAPISKASGLTAARIIFDVVAGTCGVRDAVLGAIDALAADDPADVPHASQLHAALVEVVHKWAMDEKRAYTAITGEAGNHCHLPPSLATPLAGLVQLTDEGKEGTDLFVAAVRLVQSGGGCSGSRSNLVGAIVGGACGLEAVPETWQSRTAHTQVYLRQANALLDAVESGSGKSVSA